MSIKFEEHGEGYPVILLHGFPLNRQMWKQQISPLTASGFRVILPDLSGFGESNEFSHINQMEEMALEIAKLLETLKIEQAIIGGLSMGGYITFNLFRLFPEKFSALILCDTACVADTDEKRAGRVELIKEIENRGSIALIEKMLPKLISDDTKQNNPDLVAKLENEFSKVNPKAAIATIKGLAERKDHTYLLSEISLPTLLIFGENDKVTDLENAEQLHRNIPDSKLIIIEKSGHFSNLEQPAAFNNALVEFVKSLEK